MKLVEAEAEGPIEGEDAVVTPPRPPHRRVSISVLFTLTVLTGTVVAIYLWFPARHNELLTAAIEQHRSSESWDFPHPTPGDLRMWWAGAAGVDAPLPHIETIVGIRTVHVLDRRVAVVRFSVGGEEITYLVQHGGRIAPARSERVDGDVRAIGWRRGKYLAVAVGPDATAATWSVLFTPAGS